MSKNFQRFSFIFSQNDMNRFQVEGNILKVDVHGMTQKHALRFLKNVIAVAEGCFVLDVIHGYTHGHAIKDMIRSTEISPRVQKTEPIAWNPGMTRLVIG